MWSVDAVRLSSRALEVYTQAWSLRLITFLIYWSWAKLTVRKAVISSWVYHQRQHCSSCIDYKIFSYFKGHNRRIIFWLQRTFYYKNRFGGWGGDFFVWKLLNVDNLTCVLPVLTRFYDLGPILRSWMSEVAFKLIVLLFCFELYHLSIFSFFMFQIPEIYVGDELDWSVTPQTWKMDGPWLNCSESRGLERKKRKYKW